MGQAKNALIQLELSRNFVANTKMTDSGDQTVFNVPGFPVYSGKAGFDPQVKPNGIVTGFNLLAPTGVSDQFSVAPFTANSQGVEFNPTGSNETITRPVTNVASITSVTMDETGAIVLIQGTDGADSSFVETRGAAGGPPFIPLESVEIGQVRVNTSAAAPLTINDIFQVPGTHVEYSTEPGFLVNNIGEGNQADNPAKKNAFVEFFGSLPLIHTGSVTKGVWIEFYEPILADIPTTRDFVPAEQTQTLSSEEYYGNQSIGSVASSLGQSTFTAVLTDGVNDPLVSEKNQVVTTKFFPDRLKSAYILTQGILGLGRTFPVDGQIQAAVTMSSEVESAEFSS